MTRPREAADASAQKKPLHQRVTWRRAGILLAILGVLACFLVGWWVRGTQSTRNCEYRGGVWNEFYGYCECETRGREWQDGQCVALPPRR